jgi:hypothetical protein
MTKHSIEMRVDRRRSVKPGPLAGGIEAPCGVNEFNYSGVQSSPEWTLLLEGRDRRFKSCYPDSQ